MMVGSQYKIISELGSGGMGVVYQAVDVVLEREVAIKKLRSEFSRNTDVAQRFLREAKIQARLNHPNITQLYTCLQQGDTFYIVMEFVAGTPLNRLIPLPYGRLLPLAVQVLDSLEYAHNMGVLHRDIKPDNLMVTPGGALKIMDFGIAHVLGSSRHTREKTIMGTLEYISPERIMGKDPDRRSDIYALGAVLFEALTGRLPFESNSEYELLRRHMEEEPPKLRQILPDCPDYLESIVDRALAKDPEARFESCREIKDILSAEMARSPELFRSGSSLRRDVSDEIERCEQRVMALVGSGDVDLAQRVLDTARIEYGRQEQIEAIQKLLDDARRKAAAPSKGEQRQQVAAILQEILSLEQKKEWKAARKLAADSLQKHVNVKALQIAVLYLCEKEAAGDHA
jgi:serine/threonine protein kinase